MEQHTRPFLCYQWKNAARIVSREDSDMITVVGESVHTESPTVYGPFYTKFEAGSWLHAQAKKLLHDLKEQSKGGVVVYAENKWELPEDRQEPDYAELTEDDDAVTWWRVVEVTKPEDAQ